MRKRTIFVFGLVAGCLAMLPLGLKWRSERRGGCGYDRVPVVVLAVDAVAGTEVTFDMISQRSIPEQFVTSSFVKPDSASYVVGQRLLIDAQAGDMLRWADFGVDKLHVEKRARAMTIDVEAARALSGQLTRRDRVDVLVTMADPKTNARIAKTLIENVLILGITGTQVTLLVTSEESERLLLAQDVGRFALTLRNPEDVDQVSESSPTTIDTVLTGKRAATICHRPPLQMIVPKKP